MARKVAAGDRRDIQITTYVSETEYRAIVARYQASSATSMREYQRRVLMGKTTKSLPKVEVAQVYMVLGEIGQTLGLMLKSLELIEQQTGLGSQNLPMQFNETLKALETLSGQIQQLRQQMFSTKREEQR